jgi:hypothetical protein
MGRSQSTAIIKETLPTPPPPVSKLVARLFPSLQPSSQSNSAPNQVIF